MAKHTDIHDDRLNINIEEEHLWLECVESNNYTYLAFTLEQAEAILKDLNEQVSALKGSVPIEDGIGLRSMINPGHDYPLTVEELEEAVDNLNERVFQLEARRLHSAQMPVFHVDN